MSDKHKKAPGPAPVPHHETPPGGTYTHPIEKPPPAPKPPVKPPPPKPKPPPPPNPWGTGQQSIYDLMNSTLASWGLGSLSTDLKNLILKGDTSPDTLSLALSQTDAYKQRFSGNAERVKNGYAELSPAQYIAMEEGYRNVLSAYGISGYYDSKANFNKLIGGDVSATELQERAQVAHDQYMAAPDSTRALWEQYYGTKGDMVAAILDPNTPLQLIKDRGQQVAIGGAAAMSGFGINQQRAQQFQEAGVTLNQAQQAYQRLSQIIPTDQAIAQRFGTSFGQADEENDLLLGNGAAANQRQVLYDEEKGLFKSTASTDSNALGVSQGH